MTASWKPLSLSPVDHPVAPLFTKPPTTTPPTVTAVDASLDTTFTDSLPSTSVERSNTNIFGVTYAIYTLTPVRKDNIDVLLQTIRRNRGYDSWRSKIALAPTFDFSQGTLRDIYEYHMRLVDQGMHAAVCPSKLIVVTHADWASNGVLVVDLDCLGRYVQGSVGFVRLGVYTITASLMMLEASGLYWNDLKRHELQTSWPSPIVGYTGSKHERPEAQLAS